MAELGKGTYMNVEIAQRLATLRREKGYSQEELAEKLGLSRQAVSKWERAESAPDVGNLIALAKLYNVTLDDLLRVDDDVIDDVRFEETDKAAAAESPQPPAPMGAPQVPAGVPLPVQPPNYDEPQASYAASAGTAGIPQMQQPPTSQAPQPPTSPVVQDTSTKGPWLSFPYPILCVVVFLLIGIFIGAWHPGWIVFLTIPLYYWIANIIENDPTYRARRDTYK